MVKVRVVCDRCGCVIVDERSRLTIEEFAGPIDQGPRVTREDDLCGPCASALRAWLEAGPPSRAGRDHIELKARGEVDRRKLELVVDQVVAELAGAHARRIVSVSSSGTALAVAWVDAPSDLERAAVAAAWSAAGGDPASVDHTVA